MSAAPVCGVLNHYSDGSSWTCGLPKLHDGIHRPKDPVRIVCDVCRSVLIVERSLATLDDDGSIVSRCPLHLEGSTL